MWKSLVYIIDRACAKRDLPISPFSWGTEYLTLEKVENEEEFINRFNKKVLEEGEEFFSFKMI